MVEKICGKVSFELEWNSESLEWNSETYQDGFHVAIPGLTVEQLGSQTAMAITAPANNRRII